MDLNYHLLSFLTQMLFLQVLVVVWKWTAFHTLRENNVAIILSRNFVVNNRSIYREDAEDPITSSSIQNPIAMLALMYLQRFPAVKRVHRRIWWCNWPITMDSMRHLENVKTSLPCKLISLYSSHRGRINLCRFLLAKKHTKSLKIVVNVRYFTGEALSVNCP